MRVQKELRSSSGVDFDYFVGIYRSDCKRSNSFIVTETGFIMGIIILDVLSFEALAAESWDVF